MDREELEEIIKGEKFIHAVELASELDEISSGIIQREMSISFPEAINLIDAMNELGMITPIDKYTYKCMVSQDQSNALRNGKFIIPSNSKMIDNTSLITEFLLKKKLPFRLNSLKRTYEENGDDNPLVIFELEVDEIPSFEISYNLGEHSVLVTSYYELLSRIIEENYLALKEMFKNDKGIFDSMLPIESHAEPGYFVGIQLSVRFNDQEFDEEKLEEIYTYLINKTNFIKELAQVSRKARK